jgi:hypothetical protein
MAERRAAQSIEVGDAVLHGTHLRGVYLVAVPPQGWHTIRGPSVLGSPLSPLALGRGLLVQPPSFRLWRFRLKMKELGALLHHWNWVADVLLQAAPYPGNKGAYFEIIIRESRAFGCLLFIGRKPHINSSKGRLNL